MVGGPLVARYPRVAHATGADFFATDFETGLDMARSVPIEREGTRRAR